MDEKLYPFGKKQLFEEMDRVDKQARVLNDRVPLPHLVEQWDDREHQVLDLACGPGAWSMDMAQRFSCWRVIGLDISENMIDFARVQAKANRVQNVAFQVVNALAGLPFADNSLDFIHARLLQCFMPIGAWGGLLAECRRVLRPGGIIQMVEATLPECNKAANTWFGAQAAAMWHIRGITGSPDGRLFGVNNMLAYFLRSAGFVVESEMPYIVNYSWGTPLHQIWCENVLAVMKQLPKILVGMGIPAEETERMAEQAAKEMDEEDFCALFFFLSVVARKSDTSTE